VEDACETEALMNLNAHMGKYENGMEKIGTNSAF